MLKEKKYLILKKILWASWFFTLNPITFFRKQLLKSKGKSASKIKLKTDPASEPVSLQYLRTENPCRASESSYHSSSIPSGSKAWTVSLCTSVYVHIWILWLTSTVKKGGKHKDNFLQVSHKLAAERNTLCALADPRHHFQHESSLYQISRIHTAGPLQQRSQSELLNNKKIQNH